MSQCRRRPGSVVQALADARRLFGIGAGKSYHFEVVPLRSGMTGSDGGRS